MNQNLFSHISYYRIYTEWLVLPQYRETTVGPLSIKKCTHHLLAANLINILAASKLQQFTIAIKLYYRINGFGRARHLGLA